MNYKQYIIPDLQSLNAWRAALTTIPERIRALEMAYGAIRSAMTDATPVAGGTTVRDEMLVSNIAERDKLKSNLEITRHNVKRLESALELLPRDERIILERFYVNRDKNHLARRYPTYDLLAAASAEELSQIDTIGPVIASSIVQFVQLDANKRLMEELHYEKTQIYQLKERGLIDLARILLGVVEL